jgi:hypothetical protein
MHIKIMVERMCRWQADTCLRRNARHGLEVQFSGIPTHGGAACVAVAVQACGLRDGVSAMFTEGEPLADAVLRWDEVNKYYYSNFDSKDYIQ